MEVMPQQNSLAKAVTLAYAPHPFGLDRQVMPVFAGITIHKACINAGVDGDQPIVIFLNGLIVPVSDWKTKTLNEGDFLTVQAEVTGGGDGGSNPIAVVAMIALTVAMPYAVAAMGFTAGTFAAAAVSAGLMMAGSMVINSIFPPSMPSTNFNGGAYEQPSPTYSLTGGSNRMRPYEAMPLIMGTHRFFPDAAMRPYTEYRDQDQYLYQLFNAGLIPATLTDFKIGNSAISSFSDVSLTVGGIGNFPKNVDTQSGFVLSSSAGWVQRTSSNNTYHIQLDIDALLFSANNSGGMDKTECELNIEYRPVGTTTWLPFTQGFRKEAVYKEEEFTNYGYDEYDIYYETTGTRTVLVSSVDSGNKSTIGNASQKPLRLTYEFIPSVAGTFEIRIRKVTTDSTETRLKNDISVSAIRSYQKDTTNYSGMNMIALVVKATDQLNGAVAQLSCLASSKAQVWNGSAWIEQVTSNPAHWFMDFCKGRFINGRLAYGLGLTNNQIDLTSLLAWVGFCNSEGLTFNAIIDGAKTAADVLQMIGRAGFGSPSWSSGKLGVVCDGRMQPPVAVFGMANIIKGSFNVSYLTDQLADEFVVSYTDPEDDYNQAQVRVANVATPINSTNVDLFGCTSKAMAGKFANYLAAQQIYRRRKVTWETDAEGFVCQRGDVVLLSHDLTQWGYSGRVLAISGSTVTLDRTVSSTNGNYLLVRHSDGSLTTHTTSTVGNSSVLTVSPSVVDSAPLDCVYTFSPLATQGKRVKITSIQPINNHRLRIVATDDDAEFYAAWNGTFNTVTKQTLLKDIKPSVSNLTATESLAYVGGFVVSQVALNMSFSANTDSVSVRYKLEQDANWTMINSNQPNITFTLGNNTGKLSIVVTPTAGLVVGDSSSISVFIYGKSLPPNSVSDFSVINSAGNAIATWSASPDLDVRVGGRFEIRHTRESVGNWDNSYWISTVGGASTSAFLPAITGAYLIRAIDDSGNKSPYSLFYLTASDLLSATQIASITGFNGVKTNVVTDANGFLMLSSTPSGVVTQGELLHASLMDFGVIKNVRLSVFTTVNAYISNNLIDSYPDIDSISSIEGQADLLGMDAFFYVSTSNMQANVATDWTPYTPFINSDFKCRSAKFKIVLKSSSAIHNIQVKDFLITALELS